jgi:hypothetical protein
MNELTCTFEEFKQKAKEFTDAAFSLNLEELENAYKCLGLSYLNMSEPMWERSSVIVLNMCNRVFLEREAELMEI